MCRWQIKVFFQLAPPITEKFISLTIHRLVQIHPNKLISATTLGDGNDPIESVCTSFDRQHVFASSHDYKLYPFEIASLWADKSENAAISNETGEEIEGSDDESPELTKQEKKRQRQTSMQSTDYKLEKNNKSKKMKSSITTSEAANFFADL